MFPCSFSLVRTHGRETRKHTIFLILTFIVFLNISGRRRRRGYVSEFCSGKVDFFTMEEVEVLLQNQVTLFVYERAFE